MNARKGLVLDANILIRAVFGQRVRQILEAYEDVAGFYSPDVCFQDARKNSPALLRSNRAKHVLPTRSRSPSVCTALFFSICATVRRLARKMGVSRGILPAPCAFGERYRRSALLSDSARR